MLRLNSKRIRTESFSAKDTGRLGFQLGQVLATGDVVLLMGQLGAGKTTFVQGLVRGLGVHEPALSPTFIIAQTLKGRATVHHLDFYRMTPKELLAMGVADYFMGASEIGPGVVLVEWADRCPEVWPTERLEIRISLGAKPTARRIELRPLGKHYEKVLQNMKGQRSR